MRSMTGFGQAQGESARLRVAATVRCVNHRHLDLVVHLPEALRPREPALREILRAELHRGRVDVRVEVTYLGERSWRVDVMRGAVEELSRATRDLAECGLAVGELRVADLMRLPEVVKVAGEPHEWSDDDDRLVLEVVAGARDQAVAARRGEGERLRAAIVARLGELAALVAAIEARRPEARERLTETFRSRVRELIEDAAVGEERMAQELALLLERTDVQEELDRLRAHLEQASRLADEAAPVGRRLDFLSQELLRELNTLGAKSRDLPILQTVLDAKAACDQLREQVQNVE